MGDLKLDRAQVASALEEIGTLLELKGENPFKVRAYAAGARTLETLGDEFTARVTQGTLTDLAGIGEALAEKITTLATTGSLPFLETLRAEVPEGLRALTQLPGLGPRRARRLHAELGIDSLYALAEACRSGKVEQIAGFGKKSQAALLEAIQYAESVSGSMLLSQAMQLAEGLLAGVRKLKGVARAEACGSLRRRKEVIRDIDILASCRRGADPAALIQAFLKLPAARDARRIMAAGDTKASLILAGGRQVDLRVVSDVEFPYALHYFTGSKEHNIAIRRLAIERGWKINEYGLWKGGTRIACRDEEEIFAKLGLDWIPPELREDAGEIDAAASGSLPALLEPAQIRGVFHVHSTWSDGTDTLDAMIGAAAQRGYEYVGISDHSRSAVYAGGLSLEQVTRQRAEIASLRRRYPRLGILHGIESDILRNGDLDYPQAVLEEFDFVIGAVHSSLTLDEAAQTRRVLKAIQNPHLRILGHPTGRLLLQREGLRIDMDQVIAAAARAGKAIELNASPHRLDLESRRCRQARAARALVSINPDAHSAGGLGDIAYGVATARRGWLEASDVLNTRSLGQVRTWLKEARA